MGGLSEEEIERMVQEAEEFAEEDKKKGIADKISEEDKETIEEAVKDALEWLDDNQEAEKEDYEAKQKEVEAIANPIIQTVYQESGAGGDDEDDEEDEEDDEDEL